MAYIISSGESSEGIVLENDYMTVLNGGTANHASVNSKGSMYVMSGGMANLIQVNSNGRLFVSSGGTAMEIMENGGNVSIANGANVTFVPNAFSDYVLSYGTVTVNPLRHRD